jgi:hypothetical protein
MDQAEIKKEEKASKRNVFLAVVVLLVFFFLMFLFTDFVFGVPLGRLSLSFIFLSFLGR